MTKLLIVDVGNTDVKRVIADESGKFGALQRDPTVNIETVIQEIVDCGLPIGISCVRTGVVEMLKLALRQHNHECRLVCSVCSDIEHPVSGFYQGFGADRIADVAAAREIVGQSSPVAVIGLGTGTAITVVSAEGKFVGGFTTLGLGSICKALTVALPALPEIDPQSATDLRPGLDMYSSLCRGTVAAHVGLVDKWISIFKEDYGPDLPVIATGGWSRVLAPLTTSIEQVEPLLTLRGVWAITMRSLSHS
jgi:pantothenate kinase type III